MSRRSAGFTLIEVMVALAVFSLAALALIRLEGATLRSTVVLDNAVLGRIVARNVAVDAITGGTPPVAGQSVGVEQNGGRAWRWTRQVTPTGDSRILRVDVAVLDPAGDVVARLTMVRPPDVAVTVS